jgi:hypothetical protein
MSEINKIVAGIGDAILEATKRSKTELKAYIDKELDTHKFSGTQIRQNTIPGLALTNGAVPLIKIGGLQAEIASIAIAEIGSATIDFAQINNVLIKTAHIDDAAITTAKIEDATITSAKIGTAEIKTANIDDAAITTAKINDAAISTAKIQDAAIETAKIKDAAIVTAKILDAAITTAKIGEAQVDSANIKDAAITNAKINSAGIDYAHIKDLDAESAYFGTSVFELGLGDELYIGRLRVNAANIAHLEVGELILEDDNGDLYKIGVDEFGNVITSLYEVQYQNIANTTKTLMSQYTIYKGASAPATPYVGQMWISTYDDIIRRCTSIDPTVEWQTVNSAELHTSFISAVEKGLDILSTGRILVQSGGEIKIASGGDINVDSLGEINVSSGGSINVASAADVNVSSGWKIKLQSADDILVLGDGLVSVIADDIVLEANESIRLLVQDEIGNTESQIFITDEEIVAAVRSSSQYYNDLSGKVSSEIYETKMSALDDAIALKASNEYVSDLEARVSTAEQTITPSEITSVVRTSEEYRADMSDISGQIGTLQTSLGNKIDSSAIADMATTAYVQTVQSTEVEQRNNAIVLAVQEETNRAVAVEGEIKTFTDSARTYFSFDLDGLNIGKQGSPFSTLLGDSKLSFKQGGVEVAYVQYNRLYIGIAEIMDILTIGNAVVGYTDVKTENSGVSAVWRAS